MAIRLKKVALGFVFACVLITVVVVLMLAQYMGLLRKNSLNDTNPTFLSSPQNLDSAEQLPAIQPVVADSFRIVEVARGFEVPWSMAFTSPTRFLVTERSGRVRVVENGRVASSPALTVPEVSHVAEEGMMGMVVDPDYSSNHFVYICYAYGSPGTQKDRVVRYTDEGASLTNPLILLDNIPSAQFHAGCELAFGSDKKLYITTGDATKKDSAQDAGSLSGKVLRINADGSFPSDNPFPNSPVWSYGHRNPQGLDWLSVGDSSVLFEAEHGPSGIDGPGGGDEINVIKKGENYGWPVVSHEKSQEGMVSPKLVFTPAVAPSSLLAYEGTLLPQFTGNIFFTMLKGTGISRVVLSPEDPEKILFYERLPNITYGRIRDITQGPDGAIYFTTSNRDGRGSVQDGDDKIFKIVPAN